MRYIHENFVSKEEIEMAEMHEHVINVRFCRDCPLFEYDGVQRELPRRHGICYRLSRCDVVEGEWPHYVHTYEDSFCNENDINTEESD